jgi:hypothetical protein
MLGWVNFLKRCVVNVFILILLKNNPHPLFGNAMFEFFVNTLFVTGVFGHL